MLNVSLMMPEHLSRPVPPPRPPKLATPVASRSFDGHPCKLNHTPTIVEEIYTSPVDAVKDRRVSSPELRPVVTRPNGKPPPPPLPPKPNLRAVRTAPVPPTPAPKPAAPRSAVDDAAGSVLESRPDVAAGLDTSVGIDASGTSAEELCNGQHPAAADGVVRRDSLRCRPDSSLDSSAASSDWLTPSPPARPTSAASASGSPVPLRPGSSSSSLSSSADSGGRPRKPRLPDPPAEEEAVYVSSATSVIYIGNEQSHDPSDYDLPYERLYYNQAARKNAEQKAVALKHKCEEENGDESQEIALWIDPEGGETDEEWLDDGHLYEALDSHYEPVETVPEAADDSDNTAGSDEEDDAEPEEDDDEKEGDENGEVLDQDQRANGIQKFAEAADEVRKRLAKNWNLTKSDIRSGISRIRKKSSSGPETPVSVVVKPKWSLRNHLRKKKGAAGSSASLSGGAGAGDTGEKSTFYLDLVIQSNQSRPLSETGPPGSQDDSAEVRSESDPGSTRSSVRRSDTDSIYGVLPAAAVDSRARARLSSTQSTSSRESAHSSRKLSSAGSVRPRTAPPAPPVANSPHSPTRTQHEPSSPPGFARSMSTQLQQSVRPLAACRQSGSLDGDLTRLPARAAPAPPRLQRSSVSLVETELYRPAASSSHDNSEYMMSAGERTGASEAEGEEQRREEEEEQYTSLLDKEPLYQVYLRDRCYQDSVSGSSEDDYETIREAAPGSDPAPSDPPSPLPSVPSAGEPPPDVVPPPPPPARRRLHSRPSAMELVSAPVEGQRSLWCQLPEVINSGVLDTLSSEEKRLQEAMFELISSEASYLKSLTVLVRHFSEDPQLCHFHSPDCVLSKADFQDLFSNADKVRQCSERFLADLERTWQENVMLHGVCDVIQDHATNHFHVYKHYCANQIIQDRKLKELREKSAGFVEVLRRLESSSQCQSLSLHSFLMLPMQRATRLPLLVSAILVKLEPGHAQYTSCQRAYQTLTRLVKDCNEEARKNERLEELVTLSRQLVFRDIKSFPLVTRDRWLVKKGELMRTVYKSDDSKLTFGRRQSRQQAVHLFLFNDLLIIAKRKAEDSYVVLDYCLRNMVQLTENAEERPDRFLLTLLSNHEAKTVEMLFSCPVESERVRWVEAVTPRGHSSGSETVYESWDCPQVQAVHPYTAQQPDELTLHVGDVLKVLRKVPDGWNQGMRLSDSALGWFPSNRCREIMSEHVRARHLRQRYQVLKITGEYLRQERERKLRSDRETS